MVQVSLIHLSRLLLERLFPMTTQVFRTTLCTTSLKHRSCRQIHAIPYRILIEPRIDRRCVLVFMVKAFADDGEACTLLGLPAPERATQIMYTYVSELGPGQHRCQPFLGSARWPVLPLPGKTNWLATPGRHENAILLPLGEIA